MCYSHNAVFVAIGLPANAVVTPPAPYGTHTDGDSFDIPRDTRGDRPEMGDAVTMGGVLHAPALSTDRPLTNDVATAIDAWRAVAVYVYGKLSPELYTVRKETIFAVIISDSYVGGPGTAVRGYRQILSKESIVCSIAIYLNLHRGHDHEQSGGECAANIMCDMED